MALNLLVQYSQFTQMVCDRVDTPLAFINHPMKKPEKWLSLSPGFFLDFRTGIRKLRSMSNDSRLLQFLSPYERIGSHGYAGC